MKNCSGIRDMPLALSTIREDYPRRGYEASERALAALWQKSHTLPSGLIAEDGRRFHVLYPGRANRRAGPDFLDCVLSTESGELLTGDVELHINAPDWYAHNHDADASYNGVVLHVVLHPKGTVSTSQQSGLYSPVVSLSQAAPSLDKLQNAPSPEGLSYAQSLNKAQLLDLLDSSGDRRFLSKSHGFAMELEAREPNQALYSALMEALGYASNRRPFRMLAERLPVEVFTPLRHEPESVRLIAIKALLFAGSGLLSRFEQPEDVELVRRAARHLPCVRAIPSNEWNLFRVRPANHPVARLNGAAHLLDRFLDAGIVTGLEQLVLQGDGESLIRGLTAKPFIGGGRALDMTVNAALPFFHAYAGIKKSRLLRSRAVDIYQMLPKSSESEITREMLRLIPNISVADVKTARRQQGVIGLYREITRPMLAAGGR